MALPQLACVVDWPGTANFVRDVVVSVATIGATVVGYMGLVKWRNEESGKADFDLARRVGKSVYRMRDVLKDARRPATFGYEYPDTISRDDKSQHGKVWAHIFNARFEPVRDCAIDIQSLRNEAEALWGPEIVRKLDRLLAQVQRLHVAMGTYVRNEEAQGAHFENNQRFSEMINAEVRDGGNAINADGTEGAPNAMTTEIQSAVEDLSAYLRTKLPKHKATRS